MEELLKWIEGLPERLYHSNLVLPGYLRERGITMCKGAFRLAFIISDEEYVIKINKDDFEVDCCAEEKALYSHICAFYKDIAFLFAKTEFVGKFGEHKVYKQTKASSTWYDASATVYNPVYKTLERDGLSEYLLASYDSFSYLVDSCDIDIVWLGWLYLTYGLKIIDELFSAAKDLGITDIHARNLGYTKDRKPIIFDYAGV